MHNTQGARQDAGPTQMDIEVEEGTVSRTASPDRSQARQASPAGASRVRTISVSALSGGKTRRHSAPPGPSSTSDAHDWTPTSSNLVSFGKRTRLHTEQAERASRRHSAPASSVPNSGANEVLVSAPGDVQPIVNAHATGAGGGSLDNVSRKAS